MISVIGTLSDINYDFTTGQRTINIIADSMPDELNNMVEKKIKCDIKSYSPARSLSANALFHLIVSLISEKVGESQAFVKNQLLKDYGQYDTELGEILLKEDIDPSEFETLHLKPTGKVYESKVCPDGFKHIEYFIMRGSHTYDSKEMRTLIEGAKSEMNQLGISMPVSEAELQRILGKWASKREGV